MQLSPKWQFRLNRYRNRWRNWRASAEETSKEVFIEQKMCPACRALVERQARQCPFCGQVLKTVGTGPTARILSRVVPTDVPITAFLILANFLMFAVEYILSGYQTSPSGAALLRLGASLPMGWLRFTHQYWRWCTAVFLHGGILHIGFNMFALFDIGPLVEQLYGRAKFITVYILTGVAGFIVSSAAGHESLGASGAIFGLLGVMIAYGVHRRDTVAQQIRSQALKWAIFSFVFCLVLPGVDNFAHFGGVLSGLLLGHVIGDDPPMTQASIQAWQIIQGLVVAGVFVCFFLMAGQGAGIRVIGALC